MNRVMVLLIIIILLFISYINLSSKNHQIKSNYPHNAIKIINPDFSETVMEKFREIDTKISSHPASFDTFKPVDVDEDGVKEKIYYVPTAMNHGAAEIWIVKDGVTIFKSHDTSNRWFEPSVDNNGFYLIEGLKVGDEWNAISKKIRYIYQDEKFVPIWYQEDKN